MQVRITLDKSWRLAGAQAHHVLPDEHLRVTIDAGADADRRDVQCLGDLGSDRCRDHLHDDGEGAGLFEGPGFGDQPFGRITTTLDAITAEIVFSLRGETDVRHDGYARIGQEFDLRNHRQSAFELHGVGIGFFHESHGGVEGLLGRALIGPERQIGHDQGTLRRSGHGSYEGEEFIDRDRQRSLIAINIVGRRVADEHDRDAGFIEGRGCILVVGGEHGPFGAFGFPLLQVMCADLADMGRTFGGRCAGTIRCSLFRDSVL